MLLDPFGAPDLFLYHLKTQKNLWFYDVSRLYPKTPVAWNELISNTVKIYSLAIWLNMDSCKKLQTAYKRYTTNTNIICVKTNKTSLCFLCMTDLLRGNLSLRVKRENTSFLENLCLLFLIQESSFYGC